MAKRKAARTAKKAKKAAPKKAASSARKARSTKARKAAKKKTAPTRTARKAAVKPAMRAAKRQGAAKKAVARKVAPKKAVPKKVARNVAPKKAAPKKAAPRRAGPAGAAVTQKTSRERAGTSGNSQITDAVTQARKAPALNRARRVVSDDDQVTMSPPSSLDMNRGASAAKSGARALHDRIERHHETSPALTGGDVDADWEAAYSSGDEAPGGDNMTPDQDVVDEIGAALGIEYDDDEELKGGAEISERDEHRWDDEDA